MSTDYCITSGDDYNQMPFRNRSSSSTSLLPSNDGIQTLDNSSQSVSYCFETADRPAVTSPVCVDTAVQTDDSTVEGRCYSFNKEVGPLLISQSSGGSQITIDTTAAAQSMTSTVEGQTVVVREDDIDLALVFLPHMVASCIAMWCCGCIFGCIGFALAGRNDIHIFSHTHTHTHTHTQKGC